MYLYVKDANKIVNIYANNVNEFASNALSWRIFLPFEVISVGY